jgi:hypothetical protein
MNKDLFYNRLNSGLKDFVIAFDANNEDYISSNMNGEILNTAFELKDIKDVTRIQRKEEIPVIVRYYYFLKRLGVST